MNRAVILVEADRFSEVALAVASEVKSAGAMWASPMFVAAVDDPGLEKVRRLEGVVALSVSCGRDRGRGRACRMATVGTWLKRESHYRPRHPCLGTGSPVG